MMRKSIVFVLILMLPFLQGWDPGAMMSSGDGFTQIPYGDLIRSAQAETKQSGTKGSPKSITKKGESTTKKKEPAAPKPVAEKPDDFSFEVKEYPDGLIGRRYNFVPAPVNAAPPFKVSIVSGTLPPGINLNPQTGGVEGEPTAVGVYNVALRVVDSKGKKGTIRGDVRVWRSLTVGEHGQFKGFDGLQMALNMAKDMDEIRIEKGVIGASGLVIPENKAWDHGIKISGGWNDTFTEKSEAKKSEVEETGRDYTSKNYTVDDPEATVLDGEGKESRILNISNSRGEVLIDNLTFSNSKGGAVLGSGYFTNCTFANNSADNGGAVYSKEGRISTFTNCTFTNNSASYGGAVLGDGTFTNCTFINNSASNGGGAVLGEGDFNNCTFTNNSAYSGSWGEGGGAVLGGTYNRNKGSFSVSLSDGIFTNCTFTNNSAKRYGRGGAVRGGGTFNNCIFINNSASSYHYEEDSGGGAVRGRGIFNNCSFTNNSTSDDGGAVRVRGYGIFNNCIFTNNSASEDGGGVRGDGTFSNCTFTNNSAINNGGAVHGEGYFINCTLYGNTAKEKGGAVIGSGAVVNSIFSKNAASNKCHVPGNRYHFIPRYPRPPFS